jgi:hypothetical protein
MLDVGGSKGRRRAVSLLGIATGAVLVGAAVLTYSLVSRSGGSSSRSSRAGTPVTEAPLVSSAGLLAKSGVRITQVAVTGDGGLVDLRYQVVDPDRAASVHATVPNLVDERTGVVVNNLFMGHKHKGRLKAGHGYYLIFTNPGNLVERGSRVTVQLGRARVAHVRVQ